MSLDFEAIKLPLDDETYLAVAREVMAECNGLLYHGPAIEAQIKLLKCLREFPEKASILLDR